MGPSEELSHRTGLQDPLIMLNHLGGLKGRDEDVIIVGNEEFGGLAVNLLLEVAESPASLPGSPL